MSIPSDAIITWELLCLLKKAPIGGMEVPHVYGALAKMFPELTVDELHLPYKADQYGSKWKTTVRSVREKASKDGLISTTTERGYWALTDKGHRAVDEPLVIPGLD